MKPKLRNRERVGYILTSYSVAVSDATVNGAADEGGLCLV